jgi:hypothetical protein
MGPSRTVNAAKAKAKEANSSRKSVRWLLRWKTPHSEEPKPAPRMRRRKPRRAP